MRMSFSRVACLAIPLLLAGPAPGQIDTWTNGSTLTAPPNAVGGGGSIVHANTGNFFYALTGGFDDGIYRYSINRNGWDVLATCPEFFDSGAALVFNSSQPDYIYATVGTGGTNGDEFFRYSISGNSWSQMTSTPDTIGGGGALVATGGDFIYAFRGNNTSDFYRYSISGNSWVSLATAPASVREGGSLSWNPNFPGFLYALRGRNSNNFWRYEIATDTWNPAPMGAPAAAPGTVFRGGSLTFNASQPNSFYALRGNNTADFWRYDVPGDIWVALSSTPALVNLGGSIACNVNGSGELYAFRGGTTPDTWRYSVASDTWLLLNSPPAGVEEGGALVATGPDTLYGLRGSFTTDFWRYSIGADTWVARSPAPGVIAGGGSLVYPGAGSFVYALQGGGSNSFYRYDTTTDAWSDPAVADLPGGIVAADGASLVVAAAAPDFIYAFAGGGASSFLRYQISTDTWNDAVVSDPAFAVGSGGSLAHAATFPDLLFAFQGAGSPGLWSYQISTDTWLARSPYGGGAVNAGGALLWPGRGTSLFGFQGGNTVTWQRYDIPGDAWVPRANAPAGVNRGGALAHPGTGDFLYAFRGNFGDDFWRYQFGETVSGTVYQADRATPLGGITRTVSVAVNGVFSSSGLLETDGTYFVSVSTNPGDFIAVYVDGSVEKAVGVSEVVGGTLTGFDLFVDHLVVRNDNGSATSNTDLDLAHSGHADIAALYADGGGATLTTVADKFLYVVGPGRYEPNGSVDVQGFLRIEAGGYCRIPTAVTFDVSRNKAAFPPDRHEVVGLLELVSGSGGTKTRFRMGDHQQLLVTGALRTVTGPAPLSFPGNAMVEFTKTPGGNGYSVHIASPGTLSISYARFSFLYGRSDSLEQTVASIETGFAISTNGANILDFRITNFDNCVDGATGPPPRHPRYVYLFGGGGPNGFTGIGSLRVLHRLTFWDSAGLPFQSNVEKRAATAIVQFINCGSLLPLGGHALPDLDDLDGDRGPLDTGLDDILFGENPTAVDLVDLVATGHRRSVLLEWQTGQELDNLGFNVYRSRFPDRDWTQVNESMILGLGDSQTGGRYYFEDRTTDGGVRYYYLLEDIDVRGDRTLHGPVTAVAGSGPGDPDLASVGYVNGASTDSDPETVPVPDLYSPPLASGGGAPRWAEKLLGIDLARAGIRLLSWDEGGALLEILPPAPRMTPEVWEGDLRTRIAMAGYSSTRVTGMPEVPTLRVLLVTPSIDGAGFEIIEAESATWSGLDLVRTGSVGLRPAFGGPSSPPEAAAELELTLMERIHRARDDLQDAAFRSRREMAAARRAARRRLGGGGEEDERGPGRPDEPGAVGGGRSGERGDSSPSTFPGRLVGLGDPLYYGGRQLLPIEINPVQVSRSGDRADIYRRFLVRIDFRGAGAVEEPDPGDGVVDTPDQLALAGDGSALKIRVETDGLYRLTRSELAAAGLDVSADPRTVRLFHLGREVAIRVAGEIDGVFDEGDEVLFYGTRNPWRLAGSPEATRHTDENVYWLVAGGAFGKRMEEVWVRPVPGAAPAADGEAVEHVEDNATFFPRLSQGEETEDHWFSGNHLYNAAGGSSESCRQSIAIDTPALSGRPHTATLEIALAGVTDLGAEHHVVVHVNGVAVGEMLWRGRTRQRTEFPIPSALLQAGANQVELVAPADRGAAELIFVDFLRLRYRRRLVAEDDRCRIAGATAGQYEVGGFASPEVLGFEVGDARRPRCLRGLGVEGPTVRFNDAAAGGGGQYLLVGSESVRSVLSIESNVPSRWRHGGNRADWIAIAHRSLVDGVEPLAAHRRGQGLATAVVDVEDLYDEYTGGIPDPLAIRAFLADALAGWQGPAPRFCVLVGDGTLDSHGYQSTSANLIPVAMIQSELLWTASDNWYAAVVGGDQLPDIAIGRLPAGDPSELLAITEKIIEHENGPPGEWHRKISLVADDDDATYDFARAIGDQADRIRFHRDVEEIHLGRLGPLATRSRIGAALDEGRLLVGFMGHGSPLLWASENILDARAVADLSNEGRYGLVTAMGCMNGMFHLPEADCLGETLLTAPRKGAMAFWGSTTLASPSAQEATYRELLEILFLNSGSSPTLGEAIDEAKARAWGGGLGDDHNDVVRTWVLLGDPASRLR